MIEIELPWPPAALSGHNDGGWTHKASIIAKHRKWARTLMLEKREPMGSAGDIPITIEFTPPDNRGDRVNFPNRMKPYFDGIADALKVNDRRFLPHYVFNAPEKPGRVIVRVG